MATEPPPFVTFRAAGPSASDRPLERVAVYQLALDLAKQLYTVVELAQDVERFYLRDTLDKKSTAIPALIARGLQAADMTERRQLYRKARKAVTDCASLLDILDHRGTVPAEPVDDARATTVALGTQLDELIVGWRRQV